MITRTDRNREWDAAGNLVSDVAVEVDVTAEVVEWSLHDQARQALTGNAAYLAAPEPATAALRIAALEQQVKALTRECSALIRLLLRGDLLDDTTGT